jgi:hypothetical protein
MDFDVMKLWKTSKEIMEGIKNTVIRDKYVEYIAKQRQNICLNCDDYDVVGSSCTMYGTQPCCASCGCSLTFKTRSLSSNCPKNKWSELISIDEELELSLLKKDLDN